MKDALLSRSKGVFYQFNTDLKAGKETFYCNTHFTETIQNENLISNK